MCLHGGYSRSLPKKNYEIRWYDTYPEMNLFKYPKDDSFKVKSILLSASAIDPTFLRQKLTADALLKIGGFAPRVVFTDVYINGAYYGFYLCMERINDDYAEDQGWNRDGNIYKSIDHNGNYKMKTPITAGYSQTNGYQNSDLANLITAINNSPKNFQAWLTNVGSLAAIEDWIAYNAVEWFAYNQDGFDKNYYLYHDANTTYRFHLINWDMDSTWGNTWYGRPLTAPTTLWGTDYMTTSTFSIAEFKQTYTINMICLMTTGELSPSVLIDNLNNTWQQISTYANRDHVKWDPVYSAYYASANPSYYDSRTGSTQITDMTNYINKRVQDLLPQFLSMLTSAADQFLDEFGYKMFDG